jgi:hypothetical protein
MANGCRRQMKTSSKLPQYIIGMYNNGILLLHPIVSEMSSKYFNAVDGFCELHKTVLNVIIDAFHCKKSIANSSSATGFDKDESKY